MLAGTDLYGLLPIFDRIDKIMFDMYQPDMYL